MHFSSPVQTASELNFRYESSVPLWPLNSGSRPDLEFHRILLITLSDHFNGHFPGEPGLASVY